MLAFLQEQPLACADTECRLGANEIYESLKISGQGVDDVLNDDTDYKAAIAKTGDANEKLALARRLAARRLAIGVAPELDACFGALRLGTDVAPLVRVA